MRMAILSADLFNALPGTHYTFYLILFFDEIIFVDWYVILAGVYNEVLETILL